MKDVVLSLLFLKRKTAPLARMICLLFVLAIVAGLFFVGAKPVAVGLVPAPWDKLMHAGVFGLIAMLIAVASGLRGWRMVLLAVVSTLLVGAADEWRQAFLPGRQAGLDDLVADGIGALVGTTLLHLSGFRAGEDVPSLAPARPS